MADRGTRNTAIAFGDFSISVAMKKAAHSRDVKTELVDRDGRKIGGGGGGGGGGRRSVNADAGEARAVRVSDTHVIRLPQDELERIEAESKERYATMTVLETIDYRQVPTERIVEAYWLQPRDGTARGLRLLAEGLRATGRVAVVKWVSTSREKLGVIRVRHPFGDERIALLLSELTFANDFLAPDDDALSINDDAVELDERSLEAARRLVKAFARHGGAPAIDTATDEAVDARLALLERVQAVELNAALEASTSIEAEKDPAPAPAK
jgi:non-homologous end joining protein Ku